ncbi:MAG: hypothetical protein FWD15_00950 [Alphaproteobacteria bacterium]|nr:hypothetical protein [Alphaproteobacteria bacterium]
MKALSKIKKLLSKWRVEMPTAVRIDICSICQLNCTGCFMRKGDYLNVGAGRIKYDDFVSFINRHPFIKTIEVSAFGEFTLHPDIIRMMEFAHSKGVRLTANQGTNFNTIALDIAEAMVKYEFEGLTISLDGASQETYSKYRVGGNFDQVILNIRLVNAIKKKYGSEYPHMDWKYVILPTNDSEAEIKKAKEMASALGMKKVLFVKDFNNYVPKDLEMIKRETGLDYVSGRSSQSDMSRRFLPCVQLFKSPQINWDGRLLGCCCNPKLGDFGFNVFKIGLKKGLSSKIVRATKNMLMGGKPCEESPCYRCYTYKNMCARNHFLSQDELDDA